MIKKNYFRTFLTGILSCSIGAAMTISSPVYANTDWPERPVSIVVPFAPGGSNDVIARKLAQILSQNMQQSFVIENKGGAGGVVGSNYVAKAKPDGYTLLFVSGSIATSAAVQEVPYNAKEAFTAISQVARAPFVVITRKDFPAKTINELLAYAKENPGNVNFGSAGLGDSSQMATELLANTAGVKMQTVGYQGIAPAQLDLVAGRLDMIITTMASTKGTATNDLPKLAFTGEQRDADHPDIPTVKEETGLDYVVDVWWGLFGPSELDASITQKLNSEVKTAVASPEFGQFLQSLSALPESSTPEELHEMLVNDVDRWIETAEKAGIRSGNK